MAADKGGADGAGGGGESACGDWGAGTVRAPAQLARPFVFFCASLGLGVCGHGEDSI